MLSQRAVDRMAETQETCESSDICLFILLLLIVIINNVLHEAFSMSLKKWTAIMDTYEKGGFGYHTTMPTDGLRDFHEISVETLKFGMPELKQAQYKLGEDARELLDSRGLTSVAAPGFQAPGVLVYYR